MTSLPETMAPKYPKIINALERDESSNNRYVLVGEWKLPVFKYLADNHWLFTEKINGANTRIYWDPEAEIWVCAGRTDAAHTLYLEHATESMRYRLNCVATGEETKKLVFYAESYGPKIQKGGVYTDSLDAIVFDILSPNGFLPIQNSMKLAHEIGIPFVPVIMINTLHRGVGLVRHGFNSRVGKRPTAEGLVAHSVPPLLNTDYSRVICKLKCRDFRQSSEAISPTPHIPDTARPVPPLEKK